MFKSIHENIFSYHYFSKFSAYFDLLYTLRQFIEYPFHAMFAMYIRVTFKSYSSKV